uniref:Circumsporozoite protein n=1 Tax=Chromera velia CCMP2878 TaxID=1169474 RepID=A0A0G4FJ26_9ALVE|eukprot:Cvel_17203.t1-p1 / transcript=Cvel_17203.t1 / gene=Cvel_17203 / organism=Chromera_velia_CCMP2878 / gene_product=Fap1 adhesin, putative / transcript_product=Fap1 adhesin, putative / location=Cvel_scaffold1360:18216-20066(+) / protein_length=617 / sequence_SO=supercontig / SO=protein_coding / is_pseudo=false
MPFISSHGQASAELLLQKSSSALSVSSGFGFPAEHSSSEGVAPSVHPSAKHSSSEGVAPSVLPSAEPSSSESVAPSVHPSAEPSSSEGVAPSVLPSAEHSSSEGVTPSVLPSAEHSSFEGVAPSVYPSAEHSSSEGVAPSVHLLAEHSSSEGVAPSVLPSAEHSSSEGVALSVLPSAEHSSFEGVAPSVHPSAEYSSSEGVAPSVLPSAEQSLTSSEDVAPSVLPSAENSRFLLAESDGFGFRFRREDSYSQSADTFSNHPPGRILAPPPGFSEDSQTSSVVASPPGAGFDLNSPPTQSLAPWTPSELESLVDGGDLNILFASMGLGLRGRIGSGGGGCVVRVEVIDSREVSPLSKRSMSPSPENGTLLTVKLSGLFELWAKERRALEEGSHLLERDCVVFLCGGCYDLGGRPIFLLVCEFCEGGDLSQFITESFPPSPGVMRETELAKEVAFLVHRAQLLHVVHKDLKTGNLFVRGSGELCWGDVLELERLPEDPSASVTLSGSMFTPGACVPWLADLLGSDRPSIQVAADRLLTADRWSLGMTLVSMLILFRRLWHFSVQGWGWTFDHEAVKDFADVCRQWRELAACRRASWRLRTEAHSLTKHPLLPVIRALLR